MARRARLPTVRRAVCLPADPIITSDLLANRSHYLICRWLDARALATIFTAWRLPADPMITRSFACQPTPPLYRHKHVQACDPTILWAHAFSSMRLRGNGCRSKCLRTRAHEGVSARATYWPSNKSLALTITKFHLKARDLLKKAT